MFLYVSELAWWKKKVWDCIYHCWSTNQTLENLLCSTLTNYTCLHAQIYSTMTKNSIFLCVYNLEVILLITRSIWSFYEKSGIIILALFLNFAWLAFIIKPGNARDWVVAGSDVIQSTQTQINMASFSLVRNATSEKVRLKPISV